MTADVAQLIIALALAVVLNGVDGLRLRKRVRALEARMAEMDDAARELEHRASVRHALEPVTRNGAGGFRGAP